MSDITKLFQHKEISFVLIGIEHILLFYFNQKTDDKFTRGLVEILKMINQSKVNKEIAQIILKL